MTDAALRRSFDAHALDWIIPGWDAPARVGAFMTTRNGGVLDAPCATLDIGGVDAPSGNFAHAAAVTEDRRRIAAFLPAPAVFVEQVHGNDACVVDAAATPWPPAAPPCADALVTRATDVPLAIRIADCAPVLLAARDEPVVAAAHAGWRGLASGIIESTLAAMRVDPASVVAWIGPCIGPTAFEVGDDVMAAFCTSDGQAASHFAPLRAGKWLADLPALAARRLAKAGVGAIVRDGSCTLSEPQRFFSYRRDGATGRMAALIWQRSVAPRRT